MGKISGRVLLFFFHCMKLDCFRARLQGVEVTGNMALKTSGNPLRKHQQSTFVGQSIFLVSESDFCPLLHFGCFGSEITLFHYFQTFSVIFFWKVFMVFFKNSPLREKVNYNQFLPDAISAVNFNLTNTKFMPN